MIYSQIPLLYLKLFINELNLSYIEKSLNIKEEL